MSVGANTPPASRPTRDGRAAPPRLGRTLLTGALRPGSVGRYGVIGLSGVLVDVGVFAVLTTAGLSPVLSTVISTCAAIVNNYVLHSRFNFRTRMRVQHLWRFVAVSIAGLGLAAVGLHVLIQYTELAPFTAKALSLPLVLLAQYLANTFWTFRD